MTGRRARRKAAQAKVSAGMSPATPGLPATPTPAPVASVRARKTLREQQQGKGSAALSSSDQLVSARIKHLEKVAAWASAAVPPLGAFLGARLAATCEAAGLAPSPAAQRSTCQRCESFLVPDVNCSVRAAKKDHRRRQLKSSVGMAARPSTYLLYKCHYCQHGNKKPAPPPAKKVKKMSPSPGKPRENRGSGTEEGVRAGGAEQSLTPAAKEAPAQQLVVGSSSSSSPFTPAPPSNSGKKRKRKGWTSLKDITSQNLEQSQAAKKQTLSALPSPLDPPRGPNLSALSNHMLRQLYSPG